ncbi:aspartate ammonia-lyase [Streptosporangium sp. CA-115845]|uniref:aspartate ammonia-lyase n=1 Tax=Streptosporangium sp. CA-115845 TaxID=3240071 RepID=UPI003D8B92CD
MDRSAKVAGESAAGTHPMPTRQEHDLLGERHVPADAYYGIHTLRAVENFPISGTPLSTYPELIWALACVKQAAAEANNDLGLLPGAACEAIVRACDEIRAGRLHEHFVVDVFQGGAGTSTNMNTNEVIANRALELLGHSRGSYEHIHPLDDVNKSQSTNDVYPTALRLGLHRATQPLRAALAELSHAFVAKSVEFTDIVKIGRTQLQEAVPMTLGQEFAAFAAMVAQDERRLGEVATQLTEINLGGTAIGTGLNAPPDYPLLACIRLSQITDIPVVTAPDLIRATSDTGVFVEFSGVLKRTAVTLSKICNDLRLLSSGPHAGLAEIALPAVQAGSSIMPGKVNPVIPEVVNQVAFAVIGNDATVTLAAEAGQLQLNAFEPVIAHSLFLSLRHLATACTVLSRRCVDGVTADAQRLRRSVETSIGLATALTPHIGYGSATAMARESLSTGRPLIELVVERGLASTEDLARILRPEALTQPPSPLAGQGNGQGRREEQTVRESLSPG